MLLYEDKNIFLSTVQWMRRHKIISCIFLCYIFMYSIYYIAAVVWFKSLIPEPIKTGLPIAIDEELGFFSGCGQAAFTVKDETIKEIEEKGLKFFKNARESERWTPFSDREETQIYEEWRESPFPPGEGDFDLFGCKSSLSFSKKLELSEAAKVAGSYSATCYGGSCYLILFPKQQTIIFVFH